MGVDVSRTAKSRSADRRSPGTRRRTEDLILHRTSFAGNYECLYGVYARMDKMQRMFLGGVIVGLLLGLWGRLLFRPTAPPLARGSCTVRLGLNSQPSLLGTQYWWRF